METVATAPWWAWVIIVVFFGGIAYKIYQSRKAKAGRTGGGIGGGGGGSRPPTHPK